jgi:superfamily II helicase
MRQQNKNKTEIYRDRMIKKLRLTECKLCLKITPPKELKNNAKFAMFKNEEICDRCAEKIEDNAETY